MDDFLKGCLIGLLVRVLIKAFPYLLVIALVIWLARTVVPSLKNVLGGIELPDIPKVSEPATKPQVGQTTGGAPGTYTVQEGDMLSKIAKEFHTSVEVLVELNKDKYPSLEKKPGLLQIGWELTVPMPSESVPTPGPFLWVSGPPSCDVSDFPDEYKFLKPPITCQEVTIDVVTKIGFNIGCIEAVDRLGGNPLGYYMEHTVYSGWIVIDADGLEAPGWFMDKEKNKLVIGPAVVLSETKYSKCGIPRN